jgi:hypothetical protein
LIYLKRISIYGKHHKRITKSVTKKGHELVRFRWRGYATGIAVSLPEPVTLLERQLETL